MKQVNELLAQQIEKISWIGSEKRSDNNTKNNFVFPNWVAEMFYEFGALWSTLWLEKVKSIEDEIILKSIYFKALMDYPVPLIKHAIQRALAQSKYPPLPADIVKLCEENREIRAFNERALNYQPTIKKASLETVNHHMQIIKQKLGMKKNP